LGLGFWGLTCDMGLCLWGLYKLKKAKEKPLVFHAKGFLGLCLWGLAC